MEQEMLNVWRAFEIFAKLDIEEASPYFFRVISDNPYLWDQGEINEFMALVIGQLLEMQKWSK